LLKGVMTPQTDVSLIEALLTIQTDID
jgi:hypothetical protein